MTEKINKYQNGKIYKIVCNKTGLVYVGSTTEKTLSKRLANHKANYKDWKEGKRNTVATSSKIFDNDDYYIVLIESFPCSTRDELHQRERYYIESTDCINKVVPCRTKSEYRIDNMDKIKKYREDNKENIKNYRDTNKETAKEYQKEYYKQNKDILNDKCKEYREVNKNKLAEKHQEYYETNKENILEYQRSYSENNKEKISEKNKIYREANKEKLLERKRIYREANKEKITCPCGSTFKKLDKSTHEKTKKHISFTENN